MTGHLSSLARDERGASLIELGLALPMLAFLTIGMVDLSNGYGAKLRLEQAAQRTLEQVQQKGYSWTSDTVNDDAALETEAETAAGPGSDATVESYTECTSGGVKVATLDEFNGSCGSGQAAARYVSISITQTFTPLFDVKFAGSNDDGTFTLTGEAAIRVQ